MRESQRGVVDIWFVVVLVVLIAAAVFTLWQINKADETVSDTESNTFSQTLPLNDNNKNNNTEVDASESIIPDGWVEYVNSDFGITFFHPNNWNVAIDQDYNGRDFILITSDDYVSEEEAIGNTTTAQGARITFNFYETELSNVRDIKFEGLSKQLFDEVGVTNITIDEIDAIQYEWNYEGDAPLATRLIVNGFDVQISYNGDEILDEKKSDTYDSFDALLSSVSFD
ncbi:MAG: hypothetical protein R3313_04500 [Candidatus Saccharimonadales bacterium]|nr:hypothetical protein [Candidatus Saccharimonadales bacterium]